MMTGIAVIFRGPTHNFPGALEFVVVVLVIIVAIFFRMYGPRRRSGPQATHRTTQRTTQRTARRPVRRSRHRPR
jgi:hypothetical protein